MRPGGRGGPGEPRARTRGGRPRGHRAPPPPRRAARRDGDGDAAPFPPPPRGAAERRQRTPGCGGGRLRLPVSQDYVSPGLAGAPSAGAGAGGGGGCSRPAALRGSALPGRAAGPAEFRPPAGARGRGWRQPRWAPFSRDALSAGGRRGGAGGRREGFGEGGEGGRGARRDRPGLRNSPAPRRPKLVPGEVSASRHRGRSRGLAEGPERSAADGHQKIKIKGE